MNVKTGRVKVVAVAPGPLASLPKVFIELDFEYGEEAAALAALDALVEDVRTKIADRGIVLAEQPCDECSELGHQIGDRVLWWDVNARAVCHGVITHLTRDPARAVINNGTETGLVIPVVALYRWPAVGQIVRHQQWVDGGWSTKPGPAAEGRVVSTYLNMAAIAVKPLDNGPMMLVPAERLVLG